MCLALGLLAYLLRPLLRNPAALLRTTLVILNYHDSTKTKTK